jgi:hypothetical protein
LKGKGKSSDERPREQEEEEEIDNDKADENLIDSCNDNKSRSLGNSFSSAAAATHSKIFIYTEAYTSLFLCPSRRDALICGCVMDLPCSISHIAQNATSSHSLLLLS